MTATFFLNGAPAGHLSIHDGVATVTPAVSRLMTRLPIHLFPNLDPTATTLALIGLAGRDFATPAGTIRVEVRP